MKDTWTTIIIKIKLNIMHLKRMCLDIFYLNFNSWFNYDLHSNQIITCSCFQIALMLLGPLTKLLKNLNSLKILCHFLFNKTWAQARHNCLSYSDKPEMNNVIEFLVIYTKLRKLVVRPSESKGSFDTAVIYVQYVMQQAIICWP